jgi:uncharacterized protein YcbX
MEAGPARVAAISTTVVKSLRLVRRERALLERGGVRGDRRFFLVDERSTMVNGKRHGALQQVVAELDEEERLTLVFPDGRRVEGEARRGEPLEVAFFSLRRPAVAIDGPFSSALSEHAGERLRLVAAADGSPAVDRGAAGAVTVVSSASIAALADLAGEDAVDSRRFRMTLELSGCEPFAEDAWLGRELHVGGAVLRPLGHVGRCLVTSRDPDSGRIDLATLDLLRTIRGDAATTEPLALGIHCAVLAAGEVAVGDPVTIGDTGADAGVARGR